VGTKLLIQQHPAKLGLEHLAVIVLGQHVDKTVVAWALEAGDVVETQPVERVGCHLGPGAGYHKGDDFLAPFGVGRPTTETSTRSGWRSSTSSISRG